MQLKRLSVVFLALMYLSVSACSHRPEAAAFQALAEGRLSITINVEGLICCDGVLRLAVYNKAAYWLSDNYMVRGRLGFIQGESQTVEIHGLPAGRYAVAVYQDKDNDNKFDRWLRLIPKEPYGFSTNGFSTNGFFNNVGQYGPVSFDQAAFDLDEDKTIIVQLNSW